MKKALITITAFLNFAIMNAQPDVAKLRATKTGTFAGITYTTPDLQKGVDYYSHLNFRELKRMGNSVFITDGTLLIQLVKGNTTAHELTYYSDNPGALATNFRKNGVEVDANNLIKTKDCNIRITNKVDGIEEQTGVSFMTMQPADYMDDSKYPNKKCGAYGEWAIPVEDLESSITWWEKLGFKAPMKMNEPYPHAIMTDGYIIVGLHQTNDFTKTTLTYFAPDMEPKIKQLRAENLEGIKQVMGTTDKNTVLKTPGGQDIFLFSMGM